MNLKLNPERKEEWNNFFFFFSMSPNYNVQITMVNTNNFKQPTMTTIILLLIGKKLSSLTDK